jgi:UDPglucose--hexose-1-phosphate uridylyltransferase
MTWEERWHPLREEWIIIAAHRQNRPWSGETMRGPIEHAPEYVPDCYLCPGNTRVRGARNPHYAQTFVFDNDHPCVGPDAPSTIHDSPSTIHHPPFTLFQSRRATGVARVVCYSPHHNLTLAELSANEIDTLLHTWQEQDRELAARPEVEHVLIFENKGEAVGVSNPHPHCQIYATNFVFKTIETEARVSQRYLAEQGRPLFADILAAERQDGRRILYENANAVAFVPYFARYAYEVFVAPNASHARISTLSDAERRDFAEALRTVLVKFDNLWQMPFPYVMVLHQAPADGRDYRGFHFHIEFHPPLRKPNLLKYLAGPEVGGGNFVSDTAPEEKAAELRVLSGVHYKRDRKVSENPQISQIDTDLAIRR